MTRFRPAGNRNHRGNRTLRAEPLECRMLLAMAPIGGGAAIDPGAAANVPVEVGPMQIKEIAVRADSHPVAVDKVLVAPDKIGGSHVDEIYVPETINTPGLDKDPHQFDPIPDELGKPFPMPDEIDPDKIPGSGCPGGQPPDDLRGWVDWYNDQCLYDISGDMGRWDAATIDKVFEATGSGFIHSRPFDQPSSGDDDNQWGDSGSKGTDDKDTTGKDSDKNPIKEESGKPSIEKDPEPEGDDPDELRGALFDRAMYDPSYSASGHRGDSHGTPTDSTEESGGEGLGFRLKQESRPDPEDGRPDEAVNPGCIPSAGIAKLGRYDAYPTPDDPGDPDGPPPRPEWSVASLAASARSGKVSGNSKLAGYTSYPTPDDPFGPPRPEI